MGVGTQGLQDGLAGLRAVERDVQQRASLLHAAQMFRQAEHGSTAIRGGVAADAFEHSAAVVQGVGGQWYLRGFGIQQRAIDESGAASR